MAELADAQAVWNYLSRYPQNDAVAQIMEATGLEEETVREVISEWRPDVEHPDGVVPCEPGEAGPWIREQLPEPEPEEDPEQDPEPS